MSEPIPSYNGDDLEYNCQTCGAYIGTERNEGNGKRLFIAGRFPAKSYHGECPNCRADVHYTSKDDLPPFLARR